MQSDSIAGAILGCAVGDALGLPYEGLSRRRAAGILGEPTRYRFLFGRGMVSDDSEHTCMVAQAFCASPDDPARFAQQLAARLRWWLLGIPAGIGFATIRAILKLWCGCSPSSSGVYSAGNGPAMRSAVLGAAIDDVNSLREFVSASTRITHTDAKANEGAFAVALGAWCAKRDLDQPDAYFEQLRRCSGESISDEFSELMARVEGSLISQETTAAFAENLGCGRAVSGYVYQTVPVVLHAWLCSPRDYRMAVQAVISCGGDADTLAAIAGAIVGSAVGRSGIPEEWLSGLWEWPRSVHWMESLSDAMTSAAAGQKPVQPPRTFPLVGLLRNSIFLSAVLGHGFRRLLPPY